MITYSANIGTNGKGATSVVPLKIADLAAEVKA